MTAARVQFPNRMNPTDALFWLLDKVPDLRSTGAALAILEHAPTRQRIREEFDRLSGELVRMRQRVVEVPLGLAPPEWVEDSQFDRDYHLRFVAIPGAGGMEELLEEISPLYATAFDPERPLWEAYVAEGLAGGYGAVFLKMHHCLTDGVGGARLFEMLLGGKSHAPAPARRRRAAGRPTTPVAMLWRAARDTLGDAAEASGAALRATTAAAMRPGATLWDIPRYVRTLTGFGRELAASRAESPLHHQRSLSRRLSTFDMSLRDIDTARERLDATNNDIVLTVVSGAMRRWHRAARAAGARAHEPASGITLSALRCTATAIPCRSGWTSIRWPWTTCRISGRRCRKLTTRPSPPGATLSVRWCAPAAAAGRRNGLAPRLESDGGLRCGGTACCALAARTGRRPKYRPPLEN